MPLALYAPALAHVATDRPLYKPGQEVLLRSVLLKRTDLSPLDGRPGRWRILAPDGTEMHTERSKAGAFGVFAIVFYGLLMVIGVFIAAYYWRNGDASLAAMIGIGSLAAPVTAGFFTAELIGDYSENPFEGLWNDVPITSLSRTIEIDLKELLDEPEIPEPIGPGYMGLVN